MEYGSIINHRCHVLDPVSNITGPLMGIAIAGSDTEVVPCRVEKYWKEDTAPMRSHKVKLVPIIPGYATESIYVSDLLSMIKSKISKVRLL